MDIFCERLENYNSLFINKAKASVTLDEEVYDARISLYYIPDSLIFLTAANTGFEIIRAAITKDSTIFINRIDKLVYIYKDNELGYKGPVNFTDLEFLLNKGKICEKKEFLKNTKENIQLDLSAGYINKSLTYSGKSLTVNRFEFFHTKTSEYIVGEISKADTLSVFSNYIFNDLEIKATGGEIEYNRDIPINLSFNRNKYTILQR